MHYWRSISQMEVDLVIGDRLVIKIKSTDLVKDKHLCGLRVFKEEGLCEKYIAVSLDERKRVTKDKIEIFPWHQFLSKL